MLQRMLLQLRASVSDATFCPRFAAAKLFDSVDLSKHFSACQRIAGEPPRAPATDNGETVSPQPRVLRVRDCAMPATKFQTTVGSVQMLASFRAISDGSLARGPIHASLRAVLPLESRSHMGATVVVWQTVRCVHRKSIGM